MVDFSQKDLNAQQRMLARHMPDGAVWQNKFNLNSNLGKMLLGFAAEYFRLSVLIDNVLTELDINKTNSLITEWEKSVGIPDSCFENSGSLEDRRRNVLLKLTNFGGIQTAQDFVNLAALFGFTSQVTNGVYNGIFPLGFQIRFFDNRKTAVHTIIVDLEEDRSVFPLGFPIPFTSGVSNIIECLFRKLAPANCQLLFRYGAVL